MKVEEARNYTAAATMPWKLLQIKELALSHDRRILPVHLQLIPTNKCNGNCPWCSCAGVNRHAELGFDEICAIMRFFVSNGTRAITITGGGEPTLHPNFYSIVKTANDLGLSIGIVSNGLKFRRGTIEHAEYLSGACDWIRISTMNTNTDGDQMEVFENIANQITCSLGISFTVASDVNCDLGRRVCETVEKYSHVTHVRFVEDIVNPDDSAMQRLEAACKDLSPKAIFQYRSAIYPGTKKCYMSRLKPLVDATGLLFPCCGVQYAGMKDELLKMPARFAMGYWSDYNKFEMFDGSICRRCDYTHYNEIMHGLVQPMKHIYHV